tara:strand:- start:453 stop:1148 length:696 start_codon:yes stop_codon:yes gene_type:complete
MGKFMRNIFLFISVIMVYSCSEMNNDTPYDSTRDVIFTVDMQQVIADNIFDIEGDSLKLTIDSNNTYNMVDNDNDNIYSCTVSNLIFGQNYSYIYSINASIENLDSERIFTVNNEDNIIEDFYGELNPTLIRFLVNMSYQITQGNFNPSVQYVDVAGTFNDWSGTQLDLVDNDIYTIVVSDINPGDQIEFKFRIDGDWDNSEFPGGYSNRMYEVVQGENILEFWYNDEGGI